MFNVSKKLLFSIFFISLSMVGCCKPSLQRRDSIRSQDGNLQCETCPPLTCLLVGLHWIGNHIFRHKSPYSSRPIVRPMQPVDNAADQVEQSPKFPFSSKKSAENLERFVANTLSISIPNDDNNAQNIYASIEDLSQLPDIVATKSREQLDEDAKSVRAIRDMSYDGNCLCKECSTTVQPMMQQETQETKIRITDV